MAPTSEAATKAGVNLRAYESAVASILSRCDDGLCKESSHSSFPLPDFPPRFRPLPPPPDDGMKALINSGIPKEAPHFHGAADLPLPSLHISEVSPTGKVGGAVGRKPAKGRLARRRAEKKKRVEAEAGDEPVPPPRWPFDVLPPLACPRSGGGLTGRRARRKEGQIESMIRCVLAMLPEEALGAQAETDPEPIARLVDFAGGTGHLALPLALLLPRCEVVLVDLKERSLRVAKERASLHSNGGIPNLRTDLGSIATYRESFDIGLALHACGEATDLALKACGRAGAAFVAAPCCTGKLGRAAFDPYVYHSSGGNAPTVDFPQSAYYRGVLGVSPADFDALARAADHAGDEHASGVKRAAKIFLEADRLASCVERYGYDRTQVALTRMEPLDASPKNDILLGWGASVGTLIRAPYEGGADACSDDLDIAEAKRRLLFQDAAIGGIDWSADEERIIRDHLQEILYSTDQRTVSAENRVVCLPIGMDSRRRRLVHFVAEKMGLVHWSHGTRGGEKTVCLAVRGPLGKATPSVHTKQ